MKTITLDVAQLDRVLALAQRGFRTIGYGPGEPRDRDIAALRSFGIAIEWTETAQREQAYIELQLPLF